MKKNILINALAVIAISVTSCGPNDTLDPRKIDRDIYEKNLRDLSKKYNDQNSEFYDPEKSFDFYLAHLFPKSPDIYTRKDCYSSIEEDYKKYDLIYFKKDAKEKTEKSQNTI